MTGACLSMILHRSFSYCLRSSVTVLAGVFTKGTSHNSDLNVIMSIERNYFGGTIYWVRKVNTTYNQGMVGDVFTHFYASNTILTTWTTPSQECVHTGEWVSDQLVKIHSLNERQKLRPSHLY